jgi:predicted phospho-2-dehydro-3-deoxyheptonate aldolase
MKGDILIHYTRKRGTAMGIGKQIRMERIMNRNTGKTVIIPLDHGVTSGPIPGLIRLDETINKVAEGGANAIVEHSGMVVAGHRRHGKDIGLIVHLSGSTSLAPDPNYKVIVCSVEKAIKIGADAVSIHINIGAEDESEMLRDFGMISEKCLEWGMPLLAMVYPRGKKVPDEKDPEAVKLAARLAAELGADIVKVPYTGSVKTFAEVVKGCPIPVVIAGGSKQNEEETLNTIEEVIKAGGAGLSMGRNAFQHENPERLVRAACSIVHEGKTAKEALKFLRGG